MNTDGQSLLLLIGGGGFAGYLVLKALTALGGRVSAADAAARECILSAKRRAADRSRSRAERAGALRDAAVAALEGLKRPSLAAAYARRAERLAPHHPDTANLLGLALRRSARYSALERFLWQRLADLEGDGVESFERTFDELTALYEGPLRRPETARVMRRLRTGEGAPVSQGP